MFRYLVLFLSILLLFGEVRAQENKRANVWYFGYRAGIDFNSGKPVALDDSQMNQREGTASICDENGKLLLYTNGKQIWNNKHKVIDGANDLGGDDTSTQSAVIIPKPENPYIYYVFTTFIYLTCIIVDIRLNQGEGGIVSKNTLMEHSTEKLVAVQHCNGQDFWLIAHEVGSNKFRSYLLNKNGIEKSYVTSVAGSYEFSSVGNLMFSPSGSKLAAALWGKGIFELYNFDNSAGIISNPIVIKHPDFLRAYGVEFSPDENFLYVTETLKTANRIFQLDISVKNSVEIIKSKMTIGKTTESYFGALKLGPDNKIYVVKNGLKSLGVINSPNNKGLSCDYVSDGFELSSPGGIGLPNFVSTYNAPKPKVEILEERNCNDVTLTADFSPVSLNISYQWYNGTSKIIGAEDKTYKPNRSGKYLVVVSSTCLTDKITSPEKEIKILSAEPTATKLSCGFYKLVTNANSDFQWISDEIRESDQNTDSLVISSSGVKTFQLKVSDKDDPGCVLEKQLDVDFGTCDARVFIPDIFTPNHDGKNDTFKIIVIGGTGLKLDIYNRWGSLIHTDANPNPEWRGSINSAECASGNYIYVFKYKTEMGEEFVRRGSVLLQR
ncbi:gliding motility-associated C-terminal domain-containing protein [Dyadobacter sp. CY356]|uniref:T9SS type B sorting domain-containing protein n=1 Tax=Dyadobacter sp. CY356 TaxID=2906442 RepID=UPI001F30A89B|nr:gliding motility-associated C-terminal domain-containing protein [Dyadobacter sp. CY356]MCF0055148.1 gliding motility-associated C-terminal domain-containing protein [Dyadobacter sp. CY356]